MLGQIVNKSLAAIKASVDLCTTAVGLVNGLLTYMLYGSLGVQVSKSNTANNTTTIIHTVTAQKTLLLHSVSFGGHINVSAQLIVRNGSDVAQYSIFDIYGNNLDSFFLVSKDYPAPLNIPAGYDICLVSGAGGNPVGGSIKGVEV